MAENNFQIWGDAIHTAPDQVKRIASAKKAATSPSSIDKENKSGVFEGSGKEPYHVTLESCTCGDFKRRKLPCKHMYRLAMELGEFGGDFTKGVNKNTVLQGQMKFEVAVDEIEKLPENAQKELLCVFFWNYNPDYVNLHEVDDISASLKTCSVVEVKDAPLEMRLALMKKNDIVHALKEMNISYPKLLKEEFIKWCAENVPALDGYAPKRCTITPAPCAVRLNRSIYSYLTRKYEWDESLGVVDGVECFLTYPKGSRWLECRDGHDIYVFPPDEITWMLDKYHCNRCAEGFIAEKREWK